MEGGGGTLFVTPEGRSLLVDTGWSAGMPTGAPAVPPGVERIVREMRALGLTKIDALIVSHYHADHVGGVAELLNRVPVGTVIDYGAVREPKRPGSDPSVTPEDLYAAYLPVVAGRTRVSARPGGHLRIGSLRVDFVGAAGSVMPGTLPGGGEKPGSCAGMADRCRGIRRRDVLANRRSLETRRRRVRPWLRARRHCDRTD